MGGKRKAVIARERLQRVLLQDKTSVSENFNDLIKSDVTEILKNYFDIYPSAVRVKTDFEEGMYSVEISARADHIKHIGSFLTSSD